MALVNCKECKKEVSTAAAACPHCGAPVTVTSAVAKAASGIWTAAKLLIGAVVLVSAYRCSQVLNLEPDGAPMRSGTAAVSAMESGSKSDQRASRGWSYSSYTDQMTSKVVPYATVASTNTMALNFPYSGANYGHLTVRKGSDGRMDVMFSIDKGQTMCRSWEYSCVVNVRFDENPPLKFLGKGPSDSSSETAFLDDPQKFITRATTAKRIRVSMDIYQAGVQVLEFETPEVLRWPPAQ